MIRRKNFHAHPSTAPTQNVDRSICVQRAVVCPTGGRITRTIALSKMPQRSQALTLKFILQDISTLEPVDKKRKRQVCSVDNCIKSARLKGFCLIHGEKRSCRVTTCTKYAHQGGFCIRHGGGKRCPIDNCSKSIQVGGRCYKHGGGRRCSDINCNRAAKRHGYCCRHYKALNSQCLSLVSLKHFIH